MRRTTEAPKRRTSLCVPDQPGAMPRPVSGRPSLIPAFSDTNVADGREFQSAAKGVPGQRRRSAARADAPAPRRRDGPRVSSRATFRAAASRPKLRRRRPHKRPCPRLKESRRGPRGEASIARAPSRSASIIARSSALSLSGRFSVMRAKGPSKLSSTKGAHWSVLPRRREVAERRAPAGTAPSPFCGIVRDAQRKFGLAENVALESMPGAISMTVTPSRLEAHDTSLGHVD